MNASTTANGNGQTLVRRLRRAARRTLHAIDQALHPLRRARAHRSLARLPRPRRIVFMCLGNICRSPYAEVAFRQRFATSDTDLAIRSAGFIGPGRPTPREGQNVAAARGIDLSAHVSATITRDQAAAADLLVVMEAVQVRRLVRELGVPAARIVHLGDLDPQPIDVRNIPDPFKQPESAFVASYARIDRCLAALAGALSGAASADLDDARR